MIVGRGLLLGCVLLAVPVATAAQGFEAVGIRALGMGGAFVAVADDATATYWNPAGLVTGSVVTMVAESGRGLYEAAPVPVGPAVPPGTTASLRQGGTLVAMGTWPVGLTVYRLATSSARVVSAGPVPPPTGTVAATSRLVTTHAGVNVLQTIVEGLHVGATIKYVHGSAGAAGVSPAPDDPLRQAGDLDTRGGSRADIDAGVMLDLPRVKVGLTARNLFQPTFDTPQPGIRLQLERQLRTGVAVRANDSLMVSLDADLLANDEPAGERRSLAAGLEQRFWQDRAALRGGFRVSTLGASRPVVTGGGSVAIRSGIFADGYVAVGTGDSGLDGFGLGLRVAF
ncbi:MAG TPA: conjugal transfer protein TraF [Luteitalea sp.]|nr:conjugal transfer protein TraF [Luteitalea sp.]